MQLRLGVAQHSHPQNVGGALYQIKDQFDLTQSGMETRIHPSHVMLERGQWMS